jgi:hypothetical protein
MALSKRRNRAATKIQMIWRGIWGRSRARGKGALDKAARNIRKNVDPRNLFVSDVKELRMRIYFALEKNQPHALPPDEEDFMNQDRDLRRVEMLADLQEKVEALSSILGKVCTCGRHQKL